MLKMLTRNLLTLALCVLACDLRVSAKKLQTIATTRVFGCSLTLFFPTDSHVQEAFLSPAFCITEDAKSLLTSVCPQTESGRKSTFLSIPVTVTDSRLLEAARLTLRSKLRNRTLHFLRLLDVEDASGETPDVTTCKSSEHVATLLHLKLACKDVDCFDQFSQLVLGDWSAVTRQQLNVILTNPQYTTGVCMSSKVTVASLTASSAEGTSQLKSLCSPNTGSCAPTCSSHLSDYHASEGLLCIRAQFVKQLPKLSDEMCAMMCSKTLSCQAFSTASGACQLFVFDKCSRNVRDCSCSRRGRVFVKMQPGLEPGKLCLSGYGDDLCGVKYHAHRGSGNWKSSRRVCESDVGLVTMADIATKEEMSHVISMYTREKISSVWLGGYQTPGSAEPAGGWHWVGCNTPVNASLWSSAEPNNSGDENAIEMGRWHSTGLNDLAEDETIIAGVVCKCVSPF